VVRRIACTRTVGYDNSHASSSQVYCSARPNVRPVRQHQPLRYSSLSTGLLVGGEIEREELWEDVVRVADAPADGAHFLGALVLQNVQDGIQQIIDGQQRMVTLSLLVLALLRRLRALSDTNIESADNQTRVEVLRDKYLSFRHAAYLQYRPRLILNQNDDGIYSNWLVQFRLPPHHRSLSPSAARLVDALVYFERKLEERYPKAEVGTGALLASFLEVVAERLHFIQIEVIDDNTAFTVFETLNARGMALSTADLLKNYLFSKAASGGDYDLKVARELWSEVLDRVPMEEVTKLLFHHEASRVEGLREKQVFTQVKTYVRTPKEADDFLRELVEKAALWAALQNAEDPIWRDYPDAAPLIALLNRLDSDQLRPLLLAALPGYSDRPERVATLLRYLLNILIRARIVRVNTGDIQRVVHRAARLCRGQRRSPYAVAMDLKEIHADDSSFAAAFSVLNTSMYGKSSFFRKYLLSEMERALSGNPIDFLSKDVNIEHILPQKLASGFPDFPAHDYPLYVERLGNLSPLESDLNKKLGSSSYAQKQPVYRQSRFLLAQDIQAAEWSPEAIHHRQQRMAQLALKIWTLPEIQGEL
jgi:Protein of unknown function DUF262/Protein of unknown function (DUF1524)